jgi:seryl-tRNA synthetase
MCLALDRALQAGFIPLIPPTLVRPEVMRGTGFLGQHSDEVYHLEEDDLYLVGTSEVPLAGYHMDEILDLTKGAKRYAGWSTCYRREAGSYGKDTRGIIRVHQFNKLEMFVYTLPEDAEAEHLRLVASNCTTYQARRLDIRHRLPADQGGKTQHVATLNGTLATTRWIVAILETHQRADGSVAVPEVLRPYLGGLEVLEPIA